MALSRNPRECGLAIEYEENPESPFDDIEDGLAEARRAIADVKRREASGPGPPFRSGVAAHDTRVFALGAGAEIVTLEEIHVKERVGIGGWIPSDNQRMSR